MSSWALSELSVRKHPGNAMDLGGGSGTHLGLNTDGVGDELLDLGEGLLQRRLRDVRHEDASTFFGKEDGRLETDAAASRLSQHLVSMSSFMERTPRHQ